MEYTVTNSTHTNYHNVWTIIRNDESEFLYTAGSFPMQTFHETFTFEKNMKFLLVMKSWFPTPLTKFVWFVSLHIIMLYICTYTVMMKKAASVNRVNPQV